MSVRSFLLTKPVLATLALILLPATAFAHHPMGGATPVNMSQGFLSGVGHPILGLDHFAFVIAVGIAAAFLAHRFVLPMVFVAATLLGTGLHVASVGLPWVEVVVALSLAVLGAMLLSGRSFRVAAYGAVFGVAGLFHGFAYGEAIFGAETSPLVAYLLGFGLTQYAIALIAGYVVMDWLGRGQRAFANPAVRISGGMVAGAGLLLVGEHVLAAVGLAG